MNDFQNTMARFQFGETAAAIPYLRTAVDLRPSSAEAKQFLAEALRK